MITAYEETKHPSPETFCTAMPNLWIGDAGATQRAWSYEKRADMVLLFPMQQNRSYNMIKPFRVDKCKNKHFRTVAYAVHGFWSGDNVRVSQYRNYRDGAWESPKINWSCGGRDASKEPDNATAAECFAKAVLEAVKVARKWAKDV